MSVQPIFLLSLPRAGSTLLQRLLSQHSKVSTTAEPWIALPFFYAFMAEGTMSVYGHKALVNAISGFCDSLPNKRADYLAGAADFLRNMYSLNSEANALYFLDKTPRYHLIVDELMETFPEAKFIFLWRNPLAIASSMIQTWGQGKWNLYMFWVDLYKGIDSLVSSYTKNKARSIAVKYEDLTTSPDEELARIMAYLDIENDSSLIKAFSQSPKMDVPGRGDPTGQFKYQGVSPKSLFSWKTKMSNPFRKSWSRRYLEWIGQERMGTMGYDMNELICEIKNQKMSYKYLVSDIFRHIYGKIYCRYSIADIRSSKPWQKKIYFPKD